MTTVTGTKTITSTAVGISQEFNQLGDEGVFICTPFRDSVVILINGRIVEPGEEIKLKLKASESVTYHGAVNRQSSTGFGAGGSVMINDYRNY